ncbi:MAG: spore coat associated protein CotJA [Lachnospiraceae bacterium]|nr:spore coat associated protein CotJA [Lachnospiraceae bacterium]
MSDLKGQSCGCREQSNPRVDSIYYHLSEADTPLAMSYVPFQHWEAPYDQCTALKVGTVFQDLCKPFCGKGGKRW